MENCKYNNHIFLLNKTQKDAFKYFNHIVIKPKCPHCAKNDYVVRLIHSNTSKSLEKIYKTTGVIIISGKQSKLNKWICKKCKRDF